MKQLAMISITALALAGCGEEDAASSEDVVRTVRTVEITDTGASHDRFFVGVARAAREATMAFSVSGTVRRFDVAVGDRVSAGEQVATLDAAPFEAEVDRMEAELESAEATLANLRAQTDRQRTLVEKDVATQARLDTFVAQEGSAIAGVKAAQAALDRANLDLSYAALTAPYEGIVVATYVQDFEEISAKEPILRILDAARIEMIIDVPERFISILPIIEDIRVTFNALGPEELAAEITEIGAEASVTTGTFPVTLQMKQPAEGRVLPGMTGRARGTPRQADERLSGIHVPAEAIFTPDGSDVPHVWVIDSATMTVEERPVTLGSAGSLGIAVDEGLQVGETVVAAGANSLRTGETVALVEQGGS
jgi:RND family efflux transporter MFP subunit